MQQHPFQWSASPERNKHLFWIRTSLFGGFNVAFFTAVVAQDTVAGPILGTHSWLATTQALFLRWHVDNIARAFSPQACGWQSVLCSCPAARLLDLQESVLKKENLSVSKPLWLFFFLLGALNLFIFFVVGEEEWACSCIHLRLAQCRGQPELKHDPSTQSIPQHPAESEGPCKHSSCSPFYQALSAVSAGSAAAPGWLTAGGMSPSPVPCPHCSPSCCARLEALGEALQGRLGCGGETTWQGAAVVLGSPHTGFEAEKKRRKEEGVLWQSVVCCVLDAWKKRKIRNR